MEPGGIERPASLISSEISNDSIRSDSESASLPDPELAAVFKAWPALPPAIKAGIVAMIGAARK